MQVNILGAIYECEYKLSERDKALTKCDGYCDNSIRRIVVKDYTDVDRQEPMALADLDAYKRQCMRHEITHAFLYESGLTINSANVEAWASCEEIVDWIAIQGPKIYAAWQQVGCLEVMHGGGA